MSTNSNKPQDQSLKDIFEALNHQVEMLNILKIPLNSKDKDFKDQKEKYFSKLGAEILKEMGEINGNFSDKEIEFPNLKALYQNKIEKKSIKEIENRLAKIRLDKFEKAGPQTGDILIWPDKTITRLLVIKDKVAHTCNNDKTTFTILESGTAFAIGPEKIVHNREVCISTDKLYRIGISAETFVTPALEEICIPVYMWTTI